MPFAPLFDISINSDATNIIVTDTSGAYNGITNTTGWGTPDFCNPGDPGITLSDITGLTITISELMTFTTVYSFAIPLTDLPSLYTGDFQIADLNVNLTSGPYSLGVGWTYGACNVAPVVFFDIIIPADYPENDIEGCLEICTDNTCNNLEITECTSTTTSVCNLNPVGWNLDPVTNVNTRRVYIEVWDYLNSVLIDTIVLLDKDVIPVIDLFPSPFNNSFSLPTQSFLYGDGIYEFKYFIETAAAPQPNYIVQIGSFINSFLCNSRSCVCNLWIKALNECDKKERAKRISIAQDADLMLFGIASQQGCLDLTKAQEIQETLNKICELDNCDSNTNCNC